MDKRTLLSVTSYVHCVPCLICSQLSVQRHFTKQASYISLPMTSSVLLNTTFLSKECSIFITLCLPFTNINWNIISLTTFIIFPPWSYGLTRATVTSLLRFLDHKQHTHSVRFLWTSDRTVAETSTWQHTTHNKQTSMPPARFEPTIPAGERLQTDALGLTATGTDLSTLCLFILKAFS
jgi:hypothetical protein